MTQSDQPKKIFLAPAPRTVDEIFSDANLDRLRRASTLYIHEDGPVSDELFRSEAADADILIGQVDLPEARLRQAKRLRAVFNVEGNFLPNVDYAYCFREGIRVLNISPVFAESVAEMALGMAIDLGRGITDSSLAFREHRERYGLGANQRSFSLYRQPVGFIGMGDLGQATLPLLRPFGCHIRAHDPWLAPEFLARLGCTPSSLDEVLRQSKVVFVVAGSTSENQGFLGKEQFAAMQRGAAFVLVSRAGVVDFDAMIDAAASGHILVATDVFPEEPFRREHAARETPGVLLSAHKAGALSQILRNIGTMVVADAELILRGLPPCVCKAAQPETVSRLRSRPVAAS